MPRSLTIEDVERALCTPLPGLAAHQSMTTRPRVTAEQFRHQHPPRHGAVLVLLYPCDGQLYLPLTRRTERVANHKGQISLPGGARDEGDTSFWDTALREIAEEIGVAREGVRRLAQLSPLYIPNSNFDVHPCVGYAPARPPFAPDANEVAEIIEMPLETLLDPLAKAEEMRTLHGRAVQVPFYRFQGHVIWGATAMVLSELEFVLAAALAEDKGR